MSDNSEILFADESFPLPTDEEKKIIPGSSDSKWKLMIVDDEQEVHSVTKMVLNRFVFDGKSLEFISGYSAREAKELMAANPDTALILLDVVMEDDHAGLDLVKYIREVLNNKLVRIILRTGQAGQAPEEKVVIDYDINDYKEKTELTSQKLFSTVVSSLRSYRDLVTIESSRKGLKKIIESFPHIFEQQSIRDFSQSVLTQLSHILEAEQGTNSCHSSSFAAFRDDDRFYMLSATGKYSNFISKSVREVVSREILAELEKAYSEKKNIYSENRLTLYLRSKAGFENLICFEGCKVLSRIEKDLIDVFCMNLTAVNESIINASRYEAEKQQHLLSESLRELNMNLTSTLNPDDVLERLLDGLNRVLPFDTGLAVLKNGETFDLFVKRGCEDVVITHFDNDPVVNEIICRVSSICAPVVIEDKKCEAKLNTSQYSHSESLSYLGIPVIYRQCLLGIIVLQSNAANAFGEKEKDIALTFASQAGIAIENARLFSELDKRNSAIENLLDNAGQGFLTFSDDLLIDPEYSQECMEIFGKSIENLKFSCLIHTDEEQIRLLDFMLQKILHEESKTKLELYLPLLPDELMINGKYIKMDFKIINNPSDGGARSFMVIVTDISNTKSLENKMEEERKILKMVVKAVTNYNSLVKCMKDYSRFCSSGMEEVFEKGRSLEEIVFEIFRSVHTFKGNFSQVDMVNITNRLHDMESEITTIKPVLESMTIDDFRQFIYSFNMSEWLDADMEILRKILGEDFFNQEKLLFIDQAKLLSIEEKMKRCGYNEGCILISEIKQLRFKPFKEILKPYHDYLLKLSESMDKPVYPLAIEGDEVYTDIDSYQDFARSLVHIFRNALDHGIEAAVERVRVGKDEYGTISCVIRKNEGQIVLSISDDGKGLDMDKIREKALKTGILPTEHTNQDLVDIIFSDEFTTNDSVSKISGRGFGLAAVKAEVEKLNGRLKVNTEAGKGTEFVFYLPFVN